MGIHPLRDAGFTFSVFLLTTFLSVFFLVQSAKSDFLHEYQNKVSIVGQSAAALMDGDIHGQLTSPDMISSPAYQSVSGLFQKLLDANPRVNYIYTAVLKENQPYLVVDVKQLKKDLSVGAGDRITPATIMEPYNEGSPEFLAALREQTPQVESRIFRDSWGETLSGYFPFYNSKGQFAGIVGVDFGADDYEAYIATVWLGFTKSMLVSLCLSLLAAWGMYHYRLRQKMRRSFRDTFSIAMKIQTHEASRIAGAVSGDALNLLQLAEGTASFAKDALAQVYGSSERIRSVAQVTGTMTGSLDEFNSLLESYQCDLNSASAQLLRFKEFSHELVSVNGRLLGMVSKIPEIAGKINFVALNASIEAARAGEAGLGFAVVANEVKDLAAQTCEITEDVEITLSESRKTSEKIIGAVDVLGAVLEKATHMTENSQNFMKQQGELINAVHVDTSEVSEISEIMEKMIISLAKTTEGASSSVRELESHVKLLSEMNATLSEKVKDYLHEFGDKFYRV